VSKIKSNDRNYEEFGDERYAVAGALNRDIRNHRGGEQGTERRQKRSTEEKAANERHN